MVNSILNFEIRLKRNSVSERLMLVASAIAKLFSWDYHYVAWMWTRNDFMGERTRSFMVTPWWWCPSVKMIRLGVSIARYRWGTSDVPTASHCFNKFVHNVISALAWNWFADRDLYMCAQFLWPIVYRDPGAYFQLPITVPSSVIMLRFREKWNALWEREEIKIRIPLVWSRFRR